MTFRFTGGSTEPGVKQVFFKSIDTPLSLVLTPFYIGGVTGSGVVVEDVAVRTVQPHDPLKTVLVYCQASGTSAATINFITGSLASGSNYSLTGSQTGYSGVAQLSGGDELFISVDRTGDLGPPTYLTSSFDITISYYSTIDGSTIG
jgi:hypothetical protein